MPVLSLKKMYSCVGVHNVIFMNSTILLIIDQSYCFVLQTFMFSSV